MEQELETYEKSSLVSKVKSGFKKHLIDTTAMSVVATPFFAAIENGWNGMSDLESIKSRGLATIMGFLGGAWVYNFGRDSVKSGIELNGGGREGTRVISDILYSGAFNAVLGFGTYMVTTDNSARELIWPSLWAGVIGAAVGPLCGYAVDFSRDLMGIEECKRKSYPPKIKNLEAEDKRNVFLGACAGLAGLSGIIYALTPN